MKKERYFKSFKEFKEFYYSADDLEIRNCKNFKRFALCRLLVQLREMQR